MSQYLPWITILLGLIGLIIIGAKSKKPQVVDWTKIYPELAGDTQKNGNQGEQPDMLNEQIGLINHEKHYSPIVDVWMPVILSILVLISALYVILSKDMYPDAQQKWAFGAVGTILGYWFKR